MHVLVTGGAGFIGTNFVRMAVKGELSGISKVTVLDKLTYAGVKANLDLFINSPGFTFVKGDICDPVVVGSILNEVDSVINFAAESHVDRSIENSVDFVNTNIVGVQVLLDALRKSDKKKRFIQVSTDEVYGSIKTGSWDESSPMKPNSPYSASKASAEHLVNAYHHTYGLQTLVTRCSNNYGPYQFPEKVIPLFVTNLIEGKKLPLYGDGKNVRDWLHVDDHCRGIHKVLMDGANGETFNIGGGTELSNKQLADMILKEMTFDETFLEYVKDRPGHDFRYSVDWSKVRKQTQYEPRVSFLEGLRDTITWYRENSSWWMALKNS
jgi:dTDP-glucose 4,6-dehydratase